MKTLNLDSLHAFVEIVDGVFEEGCSIVIEYYLNSGPEWKNQFNEIDKNRNSLNRPIQLETTKDRTNDDDSNQRRSDRIHGCTRKSIRDKYNQCTFNHLFELDLQFDRQIEKEEKLDQSETEKQSKNDSNDKDDKIVDLNDSRGNVKNLKIFSDEQLLKSDWPYFELRVWSVESKRKTFIGLAFLDIPLKAGQYHQNINIWSLIPNHPKTKLMQYFLGYSIEPNNRLTNRNDWRIALNSHQVGCISVKLNLVICRRGPTYFNQESEEIDAIEEKIQKVIISFRDARRRMQTLLKNKENIRPLQQLNQQKTIDPLSTS